MSKKAKFILIALLVVIGRSYDVITTSIYTPDLSNESNPIVKWFGAGWGTMIVLQVLLTAFVVWCCYYFMFRFSPALPSAPGRTFRQVISYMLYNNEQSFSKLLYKTPKNTGAIIASTGYVVSMVLIIISYIVGTSTLFLILSPAYENVYRKGIPYLFYIIILSAAVYFYYQFFYSYYKKYKLQIQLTS
jgi:hypothetical protein